MSNDDDHARQVRRAELFATLAQTYGALARLEAEAAGIEVQVQAVTGPTAVFATAAHNPLGSPRAFLNAHRRKAFPTFKRGRNIAAKWADVEGWMQDPARRAKQPTDDLEEQYERLLDACKKPARSRRSAASATASPPAPGHVPTTSDPTSFDMDAAFQEVFAPQHPRRPRQADASFDDEAALRAAFAPQRTRRPK